MTTDLSPEEVIAFWQEAGPKRWFARDSAFDADISARFAGAIAMAREGHFDAWADEPRGAVALVMLLDQMSRNIHRGSPLAFAGDAKALTLARLAVEKGYMELLPASLAQWLVMPFEHAEDMDCQNRAIDLFTALHLPDMVHWAEIHRDIIARFGRFPHRNAVLGRTSTPDEDAFLAAGGFSG
jgi:uncharacterized protein (DUF924 family)